MTTSGQQPRPGPSGPDIDRLRRDFDKLLGESGEPGETEGPQTGVEHHQVAALDAAHDLLAETLSTLDSQL